MEPHSLAPIIRTQSFVRTSHHDTTLPHPRPTPMAHVARGPATVRAKAQPPATREGLLASLLTSLSVLATLTLGDVLRSLGGSGMLHLVSHPDVIETWLGIELPRAMVFAMATQRDVAGLSGVMAQINARTSVELLSHDQPETMAATSLRPLAGLARSVGRDELLRIAVPSREGGEEWAVTIPAGELARAVEILEAHGVDVDASVRAYPRPDPDGIPELVIDGHGWLVTVEAADPGGVVSVAVSIPAAIDGVSAEERAAAPVWETYSMGEVG
jgi:hypothetical protein